MKKTVYRVEARVNGRSYWVGIIVTSDKDYAEETKRQFEEAGVPVRLVETGE